MSKHDNDCEHAPASKQITPAQFRELRGKFFTVRHERVKTCGHHLDRSMNRHFAIAKPVGSRSLLPTGNW